MKRISEGQIAIIKGFLAERDRYANMLGILVVDFERRKNAMIQAISNSEKMQAEYGGGMLRSLGIDPEENEYRIIFHGVNQEATPEDDGIVQVLKDGVWICVED